MTDIVIIPEPEHAAQTAKDLLSLADSVWHVRTNSDSGLRFVVPQYLADRYADAMSDVTPAETPAVDETSEPPARRRGRARKED